MDSVLLHIVKTVIYRPENIAKVRSALSKSNSESVIAFDVSHCDPEVLSCEASFRTPHDMLVELRMKKQVYFSSWSPEVVSEHAKELQI